MDIFICEKCGNKFHSLPTEGKCNCGGIVVGTSETTEKSVRPDSEDIDLIK